MKHNKNQAWLLKRLIIILRSGVSDLLYLFQTAAPLAVYMNYIESNAKRRNLKTYNKIKTDFIENSKKKLSLSDDWFSPNIPRWLFLFEEKNLYDKEIKVLEIGSWEGLSSYFILKNLPNAHLTCVDTWEGGDGLDPWTGAGEYIIQSVLNSIETNFDSNLQVFQDRLTKFKGTSFEFFNTLTDIEEFDLIYADGSHYCDDVILDAIKGYEQLKLGGIMIFDDYLLRYQKRDADNPAAAINAFLKLKKRTYKIIHVGWQIIIEKTSD